MKNVYIGLGILVILVAGYFAYTQYSSQQNQNAQAVQQQTIPSQSTQTTGATDTATQPQPQAQGKINIQAVCQSVRASTTYASEADADAFVADCVNGKHPEVIDAYIKASGHDGAAI